MPLVARTLALLTLVVLAITLAACTARGTPPPPGTPVGKPTSTPTHQIVPGTPVIQVPLPPTPTATPLVEKPTPTPRIVVRTKPTPTPSIQFRTTPLVLTVVPFPTSTPTPLIMIGLLVPDILLTDIEVTQGIQNLDNDMPLVENRRTHAVTSRQVV